MRELLLVNLNQYRLLTIGLHGNTLRRNQSPIDSIIGETELDQRLQIFYGQQSSLDQHHKYFRDFSCNFDMIGVYA